MHPTQHSTIPRVKPRILRTHDLITKGVSQETADHFVIQAASSLLSLGQSPKLHIAPAIKPRGIQELLSTASETAKTFTVKRAPLPAGKEVA